MAALNFGAIDLQEEIERDERIKFYIQVHFQYYHRKLSEAENTEAKVYYYNKLGELQEGAKKLYGR